MPDDRLILASASPRRSELLRESGYAFEVIPADVNEDDVPAELSPAAIAMHLAVAKAAVVAEANPAAWVLGADTIVAVGPRLFGKAADAGQARAMLKQLAGTRQDVITGIALVCRETGFEAVDAEVSVVEMKAMTDAEIDAYVASEQWRGKAGAYGIQDQDPAGDPFVRHVSGTFSNVVGLPMDLVARLLSRAGVAPAGVR